MVGVVGHRDGLLKALCFVINAARTNGVHVAPIAFWLRMHTRVSVDLRGARNHEARAFGFGQAQAVVDA
jgi:hypothetical protein